MWIFPISLRLILRFFEPPYESKWKKYSFFYRNYKKPNKCFHKYVTTTNNKQILYKIVNMIFYKLYYCN